MMSIHRRSLVVVYTALFTLAQCQSTFQSGSTPFYVDNGQVFTPGLAIVDAPQPYTPEGGDTLQVAIDISGDGRLSIPPYQPGDPTGFYNVTAYLYSYATGFNFTISNGTSNGWTDGCVDGTGLSDAPVAGCTPIMLQEASSTVKHVNFVWPDCLVGNGGATGQGSARGAYNISLYQNFRLNGTDYFTVFDLPISVTNSIPTTSTARAAGRLSCASLNNPLLSSDTIRASTNTLGWQPWLSPAPVVPSVGSSTVIVTASSVGSSTVTETAPSASVVTVSGVVSSASVVTVAGGTALPSASIVTVVFTSVVATAIVTTTRASSPTMTGTGLVPGTHSGSGDTSQGVIGAAHFLDPSVSAVIGFALLASMLLSVLV